jgi:glycosyltransferase involved in cell wall biosynthesis
MAKVVIIGSAHPFRGGGVTTFNHRLAKEFIGLGHECAIYSFSLQYPSFLFPGKTQYTNEPPPDGLTIHSVINSVNPVNWIKIGNRLSKERPDIIVVRFWLPLMGPAFGTILKRVRKNKYTKIICIADNIIPHEKRPGDRAFTKYFLKSCDAFITMSEKVMNDLKSFEPGKPAQVVAHPLYDNFGSAIPKTEARDHLGLPQNEKIILFFGFIRKYKGLDLLLEAMSILQQPNLIPQAGQTLNLKLLIAGEFYENDKLYQEQIDKLGIRDQLILRTNFIPDSEVPYYLCAADAVIQPYRNATQSGVTPLAFHFEKPMIVTNVGGLPSLISNEKSGLIVEPDPASIAEGVLKFYQLGENHFIPHIRMDKLKYSWTVMVNTILQMANHVHSK